MPAKRLKPSSAWKELDKRLTDELAADMRAETELGPDEVTSVSLAAATGQTPGNCYKFLQRRVDKGELVLARMMRGVRVFKKVVKP